MEKVIASWMESEFKRRGHLSQSTAAHYILRNYGADYVYRNRNGNYGIIKPILDEFRKLTPTNAVWSRSRQYWRLRKPGDPVSRMVI